jgi:hypothetical protein
LKHTLHSHVFSKLICIWQKRKSEKELIISYAEYELKLCMWNKEYESETVEETAATGQVKRSIVTYNVWFSIKKQEVLGRTTSLLSFDTIWTTQRMVRPRILRLLCVHSLL